MFLPPEVPKFAREMAEVPFWIGHFVMEWTKQERILAWLIADLENGDRDLNVNSILDGSTAEYEKRLLVARGNIANSHPAQLWIEKVLELHCTLRTVRHDVVHGWWSSMSEDGEYLLRRKSRGKEEGVRPLTSEQLLKSTQGINELVGVIMDTRRVLRGDEPMVSVPAPLVSG